MSNWETGTKSEKFVANVYKKAGYAVLFGETKKDQVNSRDLIVSKVDKGNRLISVKTVYTYNNIDRIKLRIGQFDIIDNKIVWKTYHNDVYDTLNTSYDWVDAVKLSTNEIYFIQAKHLRNYLNKKHYQDTNQPYRAEAEEFSEKIIDAVNKEAFGWHITYKKDDAIYTFVVMDNRGSSKYGDYSLFISIPLDPNNLGKEKRQYDT